MSVKKPAVVEAYLTHSGTPFITERLVDGRIRKMGRHQIFGEDGLKQEFKTLRATYDDRWKGIQIV